MEDEELGAWSIALHGHSSIEKCDVTRLYAKREVQVKCNTSMHHAITPTGQLANSSSQSLEGEWSSCRSCAEGPGSNPVPGAQEFFELAFINRDLAAC